MKELNVMLKALGDPTRFSLYCRLLERRHCVRSLSRITGITESAVSQHLKILREAGLVSGEKFGHHTHYMPVHEALSHLCTAFENMRQRALASDTEPGKCVCACRREAKS